EPFFADKQHAPARALALKQLRLDIVYPIAFAEPLRIAVIVVDTDDIRRDAIPSVIANYRPRRVQALRQVIESLHVVALCRAVRQVRYTPTLVERNPGDDAGMAAIALDHLRPLAR